MINNPCYYMAVVFPGGWERFWCETFETVKYKFETAMARHPDAIGSVVRLRVKVR